MSLIPIYWVKSWTDYVSLTRLVVCKNCLAARPITRKSSSLPWYFCFDCLLPTVSNRLEFRVYEPSSSAPNLALVYKISLTKLGIPPPLSHEDIGLCSKQDWLFTTNPDSPDCVFFLLDTSKDDKIAVITYCNGDKQWTAREFDKHVDFLSCVSSPIYIRRILYIVSPFWTTSIL